MLIKQELNFFSVRFSLFTSVRFILLIASSISSSPHLSFHFSILFLLCNNSHPAPSFIFLSWCVGFFICLCLLCPFVPIFTLFLLTSSLYFSAQRFIHFILFARPRIFFLNIFFSLFACSYVPLSLVLFFFPSIFAFLVYLLCNEPDI